jgi:phosphatidate cytidylyltransferase
VSDREEGFQPHRGDPWHPEWSVADESGAIEPASPGGEEPKKRRRGLFRRRRPEGATAADTGHEVEQDRAPKEQAPSPLPPIHEPEVSEGGPESGGPLPAWLSDTEPDTLDVTLEVVLPPWVGGTTVGAEGVHGGFIEPVVEDDEDFEVAEIDASEAADESLPEPAAEAVPELPAELPAEPSEELPGGSAFEVPSQLSAEAVDEQPAEPALEFPAEPAEPAFEFPAEPAFELPAAEAVDELPAEPGFELPAELAAEAVDELPAEPAFELPAEPAEPGFELPAAVPEEPPVELPEEVSVEVASELPAAVPEEPPVELPDDVAAALDALGSEGDAVEVVAGDEFDELLDRDAALEELNDFEALSAIAEGAYDPSPEAAAARSEYGVAGPEAFDALRDLAEADDVDEWQQFAGSSGAAIPPSARPDPMAPPEVAPTEAAEPEPAKKRRGIWPFRRRREEPEEIVAEEPLDWADDGTAIPDHWFADVDEDTVVAPPAHLPETEWPAVEAADDLLDDLLEVEPVDEELDVELADDLVEVEPVDEGLDVEPADDLLDDLVEVEPVDEGLDVELADDLVEVEPVDEALEVDQPNIAPTWYEARSTDHTTEEVDMGVEIEEIARAQDVAGRYIVAGQAGDDPLDEWLEPLDPDGLGGIEAVPSSDAVELGLDGADEGELPSALDDDEYEDEAEDRWVTEPIDLGEGYDEPTEVPPPGYASIDHISNAIFTTSTTTEHRGLAEEISRSGDEEHEWQAISAAMPGVESGVVGFEDVADLETEEEYFETRVPSDIGTRAVTGLILAVFFLGSLWVAPEALAGFIAIILLLGLGELFATVRRRGLRPLSIFGFLGGLALLGTTWFHGPIAIPATLALTVIVTFFVYAFAPVRHDALTNGGLTILGLSWVVGTAAFAYPILESEDYRILILAIVAVTAAMDIGAYGIGRAWGSRALSPVLSPNKSVEGLIGGIGACLLVGVAIGNFVEPFDVVSGIGLGVVVVFAAPLGDLAESMLKRSLGVKDMGSILPGHGGILDRIDALLFVIPAAWVFYMAIGLLG